MAIVKVIPSLKETIESSDEQTKKLFDKQKEFMEISPFYNSLGRTKLENITDKYGNELFEIRLDRKRRIVCVEKEINKEYIWLKICSHDEIKRKSIIFADGEYNLLD